MKHVSYSRFRCRVVINALSNIVIERIVYENISLLVRYDTSLLNHCFLANGQ